MDDAALLLEAHISCQLGHAFFMTEDDKKNVSYIFYKLRDMWKKASRKEERLFEKNAEWLSIQFILSEDAGGSSQSTPKSKAISGRPSISFSDSSDRSKRRKTEKLREEYSSEELAFATQMSLRASGKVHVAQVLKNVTMGSPSEASSYLSSSNTVRERTMTPEEALSVFVEGRFSKNQYLVVRAGCKLVNSRAFPSYNVLREAKNSCYPPIKTITYTEKRAAVELQALLDLTVKRIVLAQESAIQNISNVDLGKMTLICKWGCDGTSCQSEYKQKFTGDDGTFTDASIFFTSLVPLQLSSINEQNEKYVVWQNPVPSSPRYCRPIKIEFLKETANATKAEIQYIQDQIKNLVPFSDMVKGKCIKVNYNLALTMVDGKVCNAVADNAATQRCYLCKATSKNFNDLDKMLKLEVIDDYLNLGLSSLHAWIRCFECCLHLSYKLDIKKWQARTAEEKTIVKNRKKATQESFKKNLGLIVDQPKPGFGSSNDGNTARRFFQNATISAEITGVDVRLITRFHSILQAISSGRTIDTPRFRDYALETAKLFIELYSWYYMPTSIHKLLIHGPQIIASALLPIGQMSEEAQETCNKYIKKFRQDFSRKSSRSLTMQDVFCRLLISSDPYISSIRKLPKTKKKQMSIEALHLTVPDDTDTEDDTDVSTIHTDGESDDSECN